MWQITMYRRVLSPYHVGSVGNPNGQSRFMDKLKKTAPLSRKSEQ